MKKLSFKNLKISSSDVLMRDQLKTVFGGYGVGGPYGGWCQCSDGTVYSVRKCTTIECSFWCAGASWICSGPLS